MEDANSAAGTGTAHYKRWNEENINLDVAASQTGLMGLYNRLCTGNLGIVVKVAGALAALVSVYIIGYTTGYYVHRLYNRLCTGNLGIVVKVAGALAALVSVYIIGYTTGYYVHRC